MLQAINPKTPGGNTGLVTGQCPCFSGPQPRLRVCERKKGKMPLSELSDPSCFHKTGLLWEWQDGVTYKEAWWKMEGVRKKRKQEERRNEGLI